jgi:transposase-like protein
MATVQTCIIHLIRGSLRYASRKYWDELSRGLKPIYQGADADAAAAALDGLEDKWGSRYPAMIRLWRNAWAEFIPFLDYDLEIRAVICSTNAIESLNARYRRAVKARGHFPTEQAAMKRPVPGHPFTGPQGPVGSRHRPLWSADLGRNPAGRRTGRGDHRRHHC